MARGKSGALALGMVLVLVLAGCAQPLGQNADSRAGIITTIAGGGIGDGGPATEATLKSADGIAVAPDGTIYIADDVANRVLKVNPAGIISTFAGDGWTKGYFGGGRLAGDGGPANKASLSIPRAVALAADGSVFIADTDNNRVRKVSPEGVITTLAGTGYPGRSGDSRLASDATLELPHALAVAADGSLYIATRLWVRKIGAVKGRVDGECMITTVAGGGPRPASRGGRAIKVSLNPSDIAVGPDGSLYISESRFHRIRKVDPAGQITTIAGTGPAEWDKGSYSGDGGPATKATLNGPIGLALTADGTLYVADSGNYRIRRIDRRGIITTVAGTGTQGYSGDGGPATKASLQAPTRIALGPKGSLYFADGACVREIDRAGVITTVAGGGRSDGIAATSVSLHNPTAVAVASDGSVYFMDAGGVRRIDPAGVITGVAPGVLSTGANGGLSVHPARLSRGGVAIGEDGTVYVARGSWRGIDKVSPDGVVTTIAEEALRRAGTGCAGVTPVRVPGKPAAGPDGSVYVAEFDCCQILKIDAEGRVTVVAGNRQRGYSGDGGPATEATLSGPVDVAIGPDGSLYIAEMHGNRIRKVNKAGIITTVAGSDEDGYPGDDGPAVKARLSPYGVAVDRHGNIYIADGSNRIRKVNRAGVITTVAGNGEYGSSGDGGPATEAQLARPEGVAVDADGNLYIADAGNDRIRKVTWAAAR